MFSSTETVLSESIVGGSCKALTDIVTEELAEPPLVSVTVYEREPIATMSLDTFASGVNVSPVKSSTLRVLPEDIKSPSALLRDPPAGTEFIVMLNASLSGSVGAEIFRAFKELSSSMVRVEEAAAKGIPFGVM